MDTESKQREPSAEAQTVARWIPYHCNHVAFSISFALALEDCIDARIRALLPTNCQPRDCHEYQSELIAERDKLREELEATKDALGRATIRHERCVEASDAAHAELEATKAELESLRSKPLEVNLEQPQHIGNIDIALSKQAQAFAEVLTDPTYRPVFHNADAEGFKKQLLAALNRPLEGELAEALERIRLALVRIGQCGFTAAHAAIPELDRIEAALRVKGAQGQPAKCSHERRIRGANIPRRYGSFRSQVCLDCGAFRAMTHHDEPHGKWLPAEQYAAEIVNEDEEDEVAQEQPAAAPERISDTEPAAPAPSWLCHRCMKRYANQSEFDYHECARSHAPAPELPRKAEPGTNLTPGGRYRITAISGHSPVGSAHHSVGCELECSEGAECALQPKWLDAGVLGSAWAAWGEMHRGCTYVTGLELIADAPEAGK